MSLEAFIDIRYADPVMGLTVNSHALVYGTALGRILYYNLNSHMENPICEFNEECIRGVHLSEDGTVYVAIGDLYCLVVRGLNDLYSEKRIIRHFRSHDANLCAGTQVLMKNDVVVLFEIEKKSNGSAEESENVYITHLENENHLSLTIPRLKREGVPLDFNGTEFLWLEWVLKDRFLHCYDIENLVLRTSPVIRPKWGVISYAKLAGEYIAVVRNRRSIILIDFSGTEHSEIGTHSSDIVAFNYTVEFCLFASVDYGGCICLWSCQGLIERIHISSLSMLSSEYRTNCFFSMGYPYFIEVSSSRISFSTDCGVLVIRSQYLDSLT